MPSWLVPIPISSSAQSIPNDSTPLILDFLMLKLSSPEYRVVPTVARIVVRPARQFGAPQTTWINSPLPASTLVICKWSEFGWSSHSTTFAVTKPSKPPLMVWISSTVPTSRPRDVSFFAVSSADKSKFR